MDIMTAYDKEKALLRDFYNSRFEEITEPEKLIELNEYMEKQEKQLEVNLINTIRSEYV